ncbi:MAG TPA: serine hydrolase [Blastocatellia bacterium]|nr:serine hydrolase [Blastocatellia bacterium]
MKVPFLIILLVLLLVPEPGADAANTPQGAQSSLDKAKSEVEKLIAASGAEQVGVAVYDPETKQSLLINERASFHAASTMKLPVMMEVFRRSDRKKVPLNEPVEVKNQFFSIVDGSEYRLDRDDDSDQEIYGRIGQSMPVIALVDRMITWSSNLATNLLIEKVKAENVTELMRELGAKDIQVLRGVEDPKAFQAGKNNTTTAYDLMLLLRLIAEKKFLNGRACDRMIEILLSQRFNDGIPAGLPTATRVAHKTGNITKHNHDAAIVYAPGRKPYVIVVLTKGIAEQKRSNKLIADISRAVYQAMAR